MNFTSDLSPPYPYYRYRPGAHVHRVQGGLQQGTYASESEHIAADSVDSALNTIMRKRSAAVRAKLLEASGEAFAKRKPDARIDLRKVMMADLPDQQKARALLHWAITNFGHRDRAGVRSFFRVLLSGPASVPA